MLNALKRLFASCGFLLALSVILLAMCLLGCTQPPAQTILTNIDGKPVLVQDANVDGVADLDAQGRPIVIADSGLYGYAETADSILPTILQAVAGIIGVPLLVGLGAAWRKHKFGRIIANTVMSVQAARLRLKEKNLDTALNIVDETLGSNQTRETTAIIRDVKNSLGVRSAT